MSQLLVDNPFVLSLLILTMVIIIKVFLSIFFIKEPMHLFRFFCTQLAKKVNNQNSTSQQRNIAGFIATFITIAPIIAVLWLFESFVEVDWLWHSLLLYFSLGSFGLTRAAIKTAKALAANNNAEAKQLIAPYTLRHTDNLSSLCITKACIEMHLLQTMQQCFCIAMFYLILGPYAALSVRLLLEAHYSWNRKLPQYSAFGGFVSYIVNLLQWLPTRLFVFCLLLGVIGQNLNLFFQVIKKYFFTLNNSISIGVMALIIDTKLGGVALYNTTKLRRVNFNNNREEPEPGHIIQAVKRVNQVLYFSLLCCVFTAILVLIASIK